jgi:hypothetical protein
VSGFETPDGWIFLAFAPIAFISAFRCSDELEIGFPKLFPEIILFLGGELNADVFRCFAHGRIPYEVVEAGVGSRFIMFGGLMILLSGLWELFAYLKMRGY